MYKHNHKRGKQLSNLKHLYEKRFSRENVTYLITEKQKIEIKFNNIQQYGYSIYFFDEFVWLHFNLLCP